MYIIKNGNVVKRVSKLPLEAIKEKIAAAEVVEVNKVEFSKKRKSVLGTGEVIGGKFVKSDGSDRFFIGTLNELGMTDHLICTDLEKKEADGLIQVNLGTFNELTILEPGKTVTYKC